MSMKKFGKNRTEQMKLPFDFFLPEGPLITMRDVEEIRRRLQIGGKGGFGKGVLNRDRSNQ